MPKPLIDVETAVVKKNRLSKQQARRISDNRAKKLRHAKDVANNLSLLPQQAGLVVGRYGQHADIRDENDNIVRCHIRRTIGQVVCGDRVQFSKNTTSNHVVGGVVEAVAPRKNLLSRPNYYSGVKEVAANIDQILIVSALLPVVSTNMIDRYLVASENAGIEPVILFNKMDLASDNERSEVEATAEKYRSIGYKVLLLSCKTGRGLAQLETTLNHRVSIFVGQSGVGKSSLINALLPDAEELTNVVSANSGLGQHTTTRSKLMRFKFGGDLIDSPGVREFGLWHIAPDRVTWGFKEFRSYLGGCKFRDCKHLDDPGCLIRQAVEQGEISLFRYQNYHSILSSMSQQKPNHCQPSGNYLNT